jgi:RNA polymerase sigma factor (sigma-70 family)
MGTGGSEKASSWEALRVIFLRARQGHGESRERIFSFLRIRYISIARYRLPDFAEDIVQDTLVVVHERFSTIETLEQLIAFANQVLRNKIGNVYQSLRRKTNQIESQEVEEDRFDMAGEIEAGELESIIRNSIDRLGQRYSHCQKILLSLYEGLSASEICEKMGITKSQLKVRTFRCREALRSLLADNYGLEL